MDSQPTEARHLTLPIVDDRTLPIADSRNRPSLDPLSIMHVLEQLRSAMRSVESELAALAAEVANIRRALTPGPRRF